MSDGWADAEWDIPIDELHERMAREDFIRVWTENSDTIRRTKSGHIIPDGWTDEQVNELFKYWESL